MTATALTALPSEPAKAHAIELVLVDSGVSPMTREVLSTRLFPNLALRNRIRAHAAERLQLAEAVHAAATAAEHARAERQAAAEQAAARFAWPAATARVTRGAAASSPAFAWARPAEPPGRAAKAPRRQ